MEIRLPDLMLPDCFAVVQWYRYLIEVKFTLALMSQKEEKEEQQNSYDSLGDAKLLLVSIERNMGTWGYLYQKFREDEDEILDMPVLVQNRINRSVWLVTYPLSAHVFIYAYCFENQINIE
jgi:hypothetical protein